jgi:hypothetical protein
MLTICSVPISSLYFLYTSEALGVRFGMWGWCLDEDGTCSGPWQYVQIYFYFTTSFQVNLLSNRLGYTWEPQLTNTITKALVFYPISFVVNLPHNIRRFPDLYLISCYLHYSDHGLTDTCNICPERTSWSCFSNLCLGFSRFFDICFLVYDRHVEYCKTPFRETRIWCKLRSIGEINHNLKLCLISEKNSHNQTVFSHGCLLQPLYYCSQLHLAPLLLWDRFKFKFKFPKLEHRKNDSGESRTSNNLKHQPVECINNSRGTRIISNHDCKSY